MTAANYDEALRRLLAHEGGYTNRILWIRLDTANAG